VSAFDSELRSRLAEVLGEDVPEPSGQALTFFKQWLAERNLGLVPVAEPTTFAWPGRWIARVQTRDDDHAVVMFGSPSGALVDPTGAVSGGGAIEEGWLIAPLDPRLGTEQPYGNEVRPGSVTGLFVAPEAEAPLVTVESVEAIAGRGLEGDRYGAGRGTFSGGRGYELTLIEAETLEELGLPWERARRNVVTRGALLNPLVGRRFRIGGVECIGRRLAEPCAHLERLSGPGLLGPLVHRGGLRADILVGGRIGLGDDVAPID
jgi:hypothetical protein